MLHVSVCVSEADSPQPAAASAAPSAPGQPLGISGDSPAAAPLPHIGELTDASVDMPAPRRVASAAAAVEVKRASVSVVHPVGPNVVRGEEVHFLQLHPPSSKWKKCQIILEENKKVYTDTSLYKAKRILVKLSPFARLVPPPASALPNFALGGNGERVDLKPGSLRA